MKKKDPTLTNIYLSKIFCMKKKKYSYFLNFKANIFLINIIKKENMSIRRQEKELN
jgi:hypothetical protein